MFSPQQLQSQRHTVSGAIDVLRSLTLNAAVCPDLIKSCEDGRDGSSYKLVISTPFEQDNVVGGHRHCHGVARWDTIGLTEESLHQYTCSHATVRHHIL